LSKETNLTKITVQVPQNITDSHQSEVLTDSFLSMPEGSLIIAQERAPQFLTTISCKKEQVNKT